MSFVTYCISSKKEVEQLVHQTKTLTNLSVNETIRKCDKDFDEIRSLYIASCSSAFCKDFIRRWSYAPHRVTWIILLQKVAIAITN